MNKRRAGLTKFDQKRNQNIAISVIAIVVIIGMSLLFIFGNSASAQGTALDKFFSTKSYAYTRTTSNPTGTTKYYETYIRGFGVIETDASGEITGAMLADGNIYRKAVDKWVKSKSPINFEPGSPEDIVGTVRANLITKDSVDPVCSKFQLTNCDGYRYFRFDSQGQKLPVEFYFDKKTGDILILAIQTGYTQNQVYYFRDVNEELNEKVKADFMNLQKIIDKTN